MPGPSTDFEGSDGGPLPAPSVRCYQTTQPMRDRLRELSDVNGRDDYDRAVLELLDDHEALLHELADARLALVPRVAPDSAFDAAWETLKLDRFSHITQKISMHDARMLFRAVWSNMVGACNPNEAARSQALRDAALRIVSR